VPDCMAECSCQRQHFTGRTWVCSEWSFMPHDMHSMIFLSFRGRARFLGDHEVPHAAAEKRLPGDRTSAFVPPSSA